MRRLRIGVLEIISDRASSAFGHAHNYLFNKQYASIMPQVISVWCRSLGHRVTYDTYYGQRDLFARIPDDLDFLFVSCPTFLAHLAYAVARRASKGGITTVIGGPHAKAYPSDCLRFFDIAVGDCDKQLLDEILRSKPVGQAVSSVPPTEFPLVEERMHEIERAHFYGGRSMLGTVIPLLASTGCPYTCNFCTDYASVYRMTDPERLVHDLRFINRALPQSTVVFHDPNFGVKFDEVLDAFERAENRSSYGIQVSLSVLKKPGRLRRLNDTGCNYAACGIESLTGFHGKQGTSSRRTIRANRLALEDDFREVARALGLSQANIIFGLDQDEGEDLVEEYKSFIHAGAATLINLSVPLPYGGTPLYEEMRQSGRILPLPFLFLDEGTLAMRIANYGPVEYMERALQLFRAETSVRSLYDAASYTSPDARPGRYAANRIARAGAVALTKMDDRWAVIPRLKAQIAAFSEPDMRDFYDGRTTALPAYYRRILTQRMERFRGLLEVDDLLSPILDPHPAAEPDDGERLVKLGTAPRAAAAGAGRRHDRPPANQPYADVRSAGGRR